jgi:murein DD-endopeptidase MepM/ murein hydrolase activator NlpD
VSSPLGFGKGLGRCGLTLAVVAIVGSSGREAQAQASAPVSLRAIPATPVRGSLARLIVRPRHSTETLLGVEGEAFGEPLHFEAAGRSYRALAAVPLEDSDSLVVTLRVIRQATTDTVRVVLPIATPDYPRERLIVAPKYAELDSATQARVDSEVSQARAVGRETHGTTRLWSGRFAAPRPGKVTSVFGAAREFNGEVTSRHYGTDFAGRVGAPVRAAGRGVVALVADFYLAGHAVYLNHGGGLVTGYFHLSRVDVTAGDTVIRGQVIGGVGRTGRVTGPHLHWIARYGAITVDPMSLLRLPP